MLDKRVVDSRRDQTKELRGKSGKIIYIETRLLVKK